MIPARLAGQCSTNRNRRYRRYTMLEPVCERGKGVIHIHRVSRTGEDRGTTNSNGGGSVTQTLLVACWLSCQHVVISALSGFSKMNKRTFPLSASLLFSSSTSLLCCLPRMWSIIRLIAMKILVGTQNRKGIRAYVHYRDQWTYYQLLLVSLVIDRWLTGKRPRRGNGLYEKSIFRYKRPKRAVGALQV